jgi:hypothetical protein
VEIHALTFEAFMTQFHANYLQDNWEASTHCELLSMTQGSSSFWDFAIKLQSKTLFSLVPLHILLRTSSVISWKWAWALEEKLLKKCDNLSHFFFTSALADLPGSGSMGQPVYLA